MNIASLDIKSSLATVHTILVVLEKVSAFLLTLFDSTNMA